MLFFFADKSHCETLGNNYKYILGNCYYIEATAFDFTEASENCKDRFVYFGGYGIGRLFEPTNQTTNDAVIQEARNTTASYNFWLGIIDSDSRNNWQYVSSKKEISWSNWYPGLPDNYNGLPENCVDTNTYFYTNNLDSLQWNDGPCASPHLSICEMTTEGTYSCLLYLRHCNPWLVFFHLFF